MNKNPDILTKKYHILQNIGYMISFYKKEMPIFLWMCLFEILLGSMIPYLEIYLPKFVVELVTNRYSMQQAVQNMVFFGLFFVTIKAVKGGCEQGKYFLYNGKRNDIAAMLFLKSLRIPFLTPKKEMPITCTGKLYIVLMVGIIVQCTGFRMIPLIF